MDAVDQAIEVLNRIHKADPTVMQSLIFHRVPCNQLVADDPTVQVGRGVNLSTGWEVGILGIINGLFGSDEHGWGHIYANFDSNNSDAKLLNFSRIPQPPSNER